jgi:hypothetical protein
MGETMSSKEKTIVKRWNKILGKYPPCYGDFNCYTDRFKIGRQKGAELEKTYHCFDDCKVEYDRKWGLCKPKK